MITHINNETTVTADFVDPNSYCEININCWSLGEKLKLPTIRYGVQSGLFLLLWSQTLPRILVKIAITMWVLVCSQGEILQVHIRINLCSAIQ